MSAAKVLPALTGLSYLAAEVNEHHKRVILHARGMLLEAALAGGALLRAKAEVKHGEFKAWVAANCRCSYRTAAKYMQVAGLAESADLGTFDGGVDAFLDAHATPRQEAPQKPADTPPPPPPPFTRPDAEYALKLAAVAERGGSEHERATALRKLERFATGFGLTAQAAVARAHELIPDHGATAEQAETAKAQAEWDAEEAAEADAAGREQAAREAEMADLKERLARLLRRKEEVRAEFATMTREELIEWAVNATLAEEFSGSSDAT